MYEHVVPKANSKITLDAQTLYVSLNLPPVPCDKNHILVACFPKSGSTWLSEVFAQLPDYYYAYLVPGYDRREHELAFERLIYYHAYNYVAQLHCKLSHSTERYLEIFSIKPVVLVRNIFDCVISMKDFLDGGERVDNKEDNRRIWPLAHVPADYYRWPDTERLDFIIDMFLPWYFNFFMAWSGFSEAEWITYRQLKSRPQETILNISDRFSLGLDQPAVTAALDGAAKADTRKNRAEIGRGEMLSRAQRSKICQLARYYPNQDFSMIGL